MFCIKSDVITLESVETYGFVTVWTSMDDGPYWVILLMYGSHDMRHTSFRRLTVVNRTPGSGCHSSLGRRYIYWVLLTPSCDHRFRYTRIRRSFEAVSTKKAGLWH